MGDRCEHGVVIDAMTCFDCITEECESLRAEVERLRKIEEAACKCIASWDEGTGLKEYEAEQELCALIDPAAIRKAKELSDGK